jgi:hypothetical protein
MYKIKSNASPVRGLVGLQGCQVLTIGSQGAVRLSASRTGSALLPTNICFIFLVLISVRGRVNPRS